MITVKLNGGLGNQMFQYACARAVAHRLDTSVVVDISSFELSLQTKRRYALSEFYCGQQVVIYKNSWLEKVRSMLHKQGIFSEKKYTYNHAITRVSDNTTLNGYWQSPKYFEHIREIIVHDFTPKKTPKLPPNILKLVRTKETVAIHVRRGDYITNQQAVKILGVQPISYYQNALKILNQQHQKCHYIVVSDDINWCRQHLKQLLDPSKVNYFSKDELTDMFLMTQTTHNIIANSSYSWWAAYLNQNNDKAVIAPKKWFKDKSYSTKDLFPNNWILV